MVKFLEKVAQAVTGKTSVQRRQESSANAIIRQEALTASLQERKKQAVRMAIERERISADNRIKAMRAPPRQYAPISAGWGGNGGMVNILGGARPQPQVQRVVRMAPRRKVKRSKARTRTVYVNRPMVQQPAPFRVI
jgi:hypothetical protein